MVKNRPLYLRTADTLSDMIAEMEPGTYLPSEPALAKQLGVSRATLREAMRTFEEQGLIVRRQGVGTYVTEPPTVIETGLEVLKSIESLAEEMGLEVDVGSVRVERRLPGGREREIFGGSVSGSVFEVSRVIFTKGRPVAYLIDVLPEEFIAEEDLGESFKGSILNLMLTKDEPTLSYSKAEINAVSADSEVARHLNIQRGDVLLNISATLHQRDGGVVDLSRSFFLPGVFRFNIVRRVEQR